MVIIQHEKDVLLEIPDNQKSGLQDSIKITKTGVVNSVSIKVDIKHNYQGDLKIALLSPSGKEVVLHDRTGGPKPFGKQTYDESKFTALKGEQVKGNWTLRVNDLAPRDAGILNKWILELKAEYNHKPIGQVAVKIPDNSPEGLLSQVEFKEEGTLNSLEVSMNIQHGYVGDLSATLHAPSGKKVILQNREGGAQKDLKKTFKDDKTAVFEGEQLKGIWKLQLNDHAARDAGVLNAWGLKVDLSGGKDDLTKIEGIGPKIAGLFNQAGIYTFTELAATSVKKMQSILDDAGPKFKTHQPTTWGQQAAMASLGDWKNLKVWQDELDGGVVK